MRGGEEEDPARIKKIHFTYSFLTAKKNVQVARNVGGGSGNSGNARKKTFFFAGGVPLCELTFVCFRLNARVDV